MYAKVICVISRQKLSSQLMLCPLSLSTITRLAMAQMEEALSTRVQRRQHGPEPKVTYRGQTDLLLKATEIWGPFVTACFSISGLIHIESLSFFPFSFKEKIRKSISREMNIIERYT